MYTAVYYVKVYFCYPTTMYAIMYIVDFSKGLNLWSCTVQVTKIVAICTTGVISAYLCVNKYSVNDLELYIELTDTEGKKNL